MAADIYPAEYLNKEGLIFQGDYQNTEYNSNVFNAIIKTVKVFLILIGFLVYLINLVLFGIVLYFLNSLFMDRVSSPKFTLVISFLLLGISIVGIPLVILNLFNYLNIYTLLIGIIANILVFAVFTNFMNKIDFITSALQQQRINQMIDSYVNVIITTEKNIKKQRAALRGLDAIKRGYSLPKVGIKNKIAYAYLIICLRFLLSKADSLVKGNRNTKRIKAFEAETGQVLNFIATLSA